MLCQGIGGTEGRDTLKGIEAKGPFVPPMPCQSIGGTEGPDALKGIEPKGPLHHPLPSTGLLEIPSACFTVSMTSSPRTLV